LLYDDGEITAVSVKKSGWLMDCDGDNHRFKRLGFRQYIEPDKNKHRCPQCSAVFPTAKSLTSHIQSKWCRKLQDLSTQQARQLRRTRCASEQRMGLQKHAVEAITVLDIDGRRLESVGQFKYLGTLVCNQGNTAGEVIRRIQLAALVFSHLGSIWRTTVLSMSLKLRLFSAVVSSVLLYNSECWVTTANDVRLLEGFHFRCLRQLTRSVRCSNNGEVDKASKAEVYGVAKVAVIEALLRERRLRWMGHLIRADPRDIARQCLMRQVGSGSAWWRLILADLQAVGIKTFDEAQRLAADRSMWRTMCHARPGLQVPRR
jgi:uncharacterized C2H2 Zn-finger protein